MENNPLNFTGITANFQNVKPGFIFIETEEKNQIIEKAIQKGAKLIITEKDLSSQKIPHLQVKNIQKALKNINALFYSSFKHHMKTIGITGTNGKTTTASMIQKIFKEYKKNILLTTDSNIINSSIEECLYCRNKNEIQWMVMEVSSEGLKENKVNEIEFDTAIFTNISNDHLDYHKSFEDYFSSKKSLFQGLKKNTRAIINGDDPWSLKLLEGKKDIYVITYGLNSKSTITASSIDIGEKIRFNYCIQRSLDTYQKNKIEVQEFPIEMNLLGYHNIYNALAAITTAIIYEIPIEIIQRALKNFTTLNRRSQLIQNFPYVVLDDYANNPSSFEAAFQTLQSIDYKDVHVVVSITADKAERINQENIQTIANWCSLLKIQNLYITGSEDYITEEDRMNPIERQAFLNILNEKNISFYFHPCLKDSMKNLLSRIKKNDLIMLLGSKGMDQGINILEKLL